MTPQPKSPNADLDRLDALYKSGADVGSWRGWTDTITNAYPALSRELRELRERLNPQPCTVCDGTGLVDADADDGGANCGVCRNGMVDEVSRQLSVIGRQAKEIEELRKLTHEMGAFVRPEILNDYNGGHALRAEIQRLATEAAKNEGLMETQDKAITALCAPLELIAGHEYGLWPMRAKAGILARNRRIVELEKEIAAISAIFPDNAPHKHPKTGVSLLDDVRDLIADRKRITTERDEARKEASRLSQIVTESQRELAALRTRLEAVTGALQYYAGLGACACTKECECGHCKARKIVAAMYSDADADYAQLKFSDCPDCASAPARGRSGENGC